MHQPSAPSSSLLPPPRPHFLSPSLNFRRKARPHMELRHSACRHLHAPPPSRLLPHQPSTVSFHQLLLLMRACRNKNLLLGQGFSFFAATVLQEKFNPAKLWKAAFLFRFLPSPGRILRLGERVFARLSSPLSHLLLPRPF